MIVDFISPFLFFFIIQRCCMCIKIVEIPFERDMPLLEQRLSDDLELSIGKILANRQPDTKLSQKIIKAYTWEKVFQEWKAYIKNS